MSSLTRRQQEFLSALLELHRQKGEAVHYTLVAEHLRVANVTAYEMLRLLEDQGLVRREFQRSEEDRGPGRSPVAFIPTQNAARSIVEHNGSVRISEEWAKVQSQILEKLHKAQARDYEELLKDLTNRLPHIHSPVEYVAEMVTAVVLGLHTLQEYAEARRLQSVLSKIGLPGELDLNAIPGLSAGLSLADRFNKQVSKVLLAQTTKYQTYLSQLSVETRRRLAEFTREIVEIVGG
ncbi:MAG: hypothetical protein GTO18_14485 [Anaerolineales bacterium]|nr:hypothetical protein [Anaerolineales bacterium]